MNLRGRVICMVARYHPFLKSNSILNHFPRMSDILTYVLGKSIKDKKKLKKLMNQFILDKMTDFFLAIHSLYYCKLEIYLHFHKYNNVSQNYPSHNFLECLGLARLSNHDK